MQGQCDTYTSTSPEMEASTGGRSSRLPALHSTDLSAVSIATRSAWPPRLCEVTTGCSIRSAACQMGQYSRSARP